MRALGLAALAVLAAVFAWAGLEKDPAPSLDLFKALAGEWVSVDEEGEPSGEAGVTYRVTAGGSAVLETVFPGTPKEMLTVYHRDGDDLVLTHYCVLGNQPRMRCKAVEGKTLRFRFEGGANIDPAKDMHMHDATFTFVDANTLESVWTLHDAGKTIETAKFRYARKR